MELETAIELLGSDIQENGNLYGLGPYASWELKDGAAVELDGRFHLNDLDAIVVYIRHRLEELK